MHKLLLRGVSEGNDFHLAYVSFEDPICSVFSSVFSSDAMHMTYMTYPFVKTKRWSLIGFGFQAASRLDKTVNCNRMTTQVRVERHIRSNSAVQLETTTQLRPLVIRICRCRSVWCAQFQLQCKGPAQINFQKMLQLRRTALPLKQLVKYSGMRGSSSMFWSQANGFG